MKRKIGNTSTDQRVHESGVRRVDDVAGGVASEEVGVALRPDDADAGYGGSIHQIAFVELPPPHQRLGRPVHPAVFVISADVMPPWLDATGDTRDHPHARFGRRLAGHTVIARA